MKTPVFLLMGSVDQDGVLTHPQIEVSLCTYDVGCLGALKYLRANDIGPCGADP